MSAGRSELEAWLADFVRDRAFLASYPNYAAILARMTPVADPSIKRMAVSLHDGRFYLHVNVDAFAREPQYLRGVLLHEVHHVVLGHLTHPKFVDVEEPELMDLAVEMSANEFIEEPLPPAITCKAYAAFGIRPRQSTRERYDLLVGHLRATGTRPKPREGEPGASGTVDDHAFHGAARTSPGGATQAASLVVSAVSDASRAPSLDPSAGERGIDPASPKEPDAAREDGRRLVAGRTPERLVEELADTTRAPDAPLDYRAALRSFAARGRTAVHSWSRPSRRFPERVFEIPGRAFALRHTERPTLLVAIDTSLSMTRRELEEIGRQLGVLAQHARVIIAECDAVIARVYPFAGRLDTVTGRGGTDLRPVFAPEFLGAHKVDGVVYFTDGDGPFPYAPPRIPTLWVLTKPSAFGCPWGTRAYLRLPG